MPIINCAGCLAPIKGRDRLRCSTCNSSFDLLCANITERRFRTMSVECKTNWKCPECCNRVPKTDNNNTPIRQMQSECPSNAEYSLNSNNSVVTESTQVATPPCLNLPNFVTEERLREIIQNEISTAIKSTIKELVTTELKNINEKLTGYHESMVFLNRQYEDMKLSLDDTVICMNELKKDNDRLKATVIDLSGRLGSMELHMRESNIEINGIPENRSENLITTVVQLSNVIENPLTSDNIQLVTRVAKLSRDNDRPRAIVVKLRNPRARDTVLAAVSKFNKKNPEDKLNTGHLGIGGTRLPVYVTEHLTPGNKHLHAAARKKAKEMSYKFVWIRNGRVYVRKDENHQALSIRNEDSLKLIN